MNHYRFFMKIILLILFVAGIGFGAHFLFFKQAPKTLFKTTKPETRDISQIINASGILKVKGNIKIGSLVSGVIEEIYAEENDVVEKGQVLALVDNGKKDTEVLEGEGLYENAVAELTYQKSFYLRQAKLYKTGHLALDAFEKEQRDLKSAYAKEKAARGALEKRRIEYENTKIKSPAHGTIINVGISLGERITTDLDATVLFEIGKDIRLMEGYLEIDESDIGQVQKNQTIEFTVDTYPEHIFHGHIAQIAYSSTEKNNNKFYKATMEVIKNGFELHPGMTVNGKIYVAKAQKTLAITNQAFQINPKALKAIAKKTGFTFSPLAPEQKEKKPAHESTVQTRYIWVTKQKQFIEKAITTNITDNIYFEVTSGLDKNDNIIIDTEEPNEMEKVYKKWFSGAL